MADSGRTSFEVRAEFEELLTRDLLGPWDGPTEELPPKMSPAERYLLGKLVPATPPPNAVPGPEKSQDSEETEESDPDPELVDRETIELDEGPGAEVEPEATIRSGSRGASSLGLSFRIPTSVTAVSVVASWGRYEQGPSEYQVTDTGRPRRVWHRVPSGGAVEVDTSGAVLEQTYYPEPDREGVQLRVLLRPRGMWQIVDIALVNNQLAPITTPDTARLYQVALELTALDGNAAIFLAHNDQEFSPPIDHQDDERRSLDLLYRGRGEFAHGRQCAAESESRDGELRAWRLFTTCFPAADVALVIPGSPATMPGVILDMARLGSPELGRDDLIRALRPMVRGYRKWLESQKSRLTEPDIDRFAPAGADALKEAGLVADRLDRAIDLLRDNGIAREAFRFANQAMALQRVRGEVVRERTTNQELKLDELLKQKDVVEQRSWRPFQLAFVLLCLPGLTDPAHVDAHRGIDDGDVQLLFFPTGGGKTEAYLGLTAYTLAIRRLQGVVGHAHEARDGSDGVAVLMRYTLRLLTAQQFQRAAALICACESLRRERIDNGDTRWGMVPFRLGLWVGMSVTPNTFESAKAEIAEKHGYNAGVGGVLQLVACPWCGLNLSASRDVSTHDGRRRVLTHCPDPEGDCPFSKRQSPLEGIPVTTVDEEVYRLTPALIISTVDKFAQLPWKAATAPLFGLVDAKCARHGWHNPEFEGFCKTKHPATQELPATSLQPAMRLRPPDLIIQDELHLISDALGSMVGLYETVIDDLCSRPVGGVAIRPVLVASTATVRRARDQVRQVFARNLTVFPPQILDAGETFFSTSVAPTRSTPSRRYRGICAPGETIKSVEIRLMATVLEHGQALFDKHGKSADPYMTVVDYFTSTRELAGMHRLVDDDVADRLASSRVRTRRRRPICTELTSRMPNDRITSTLAELDRAFDPDFDSTAAMDRFRADRQAAKEIVGRDRPIDVLLATSMLQVGVDVPRLGLMVVTGQPKNTAEYIQATSRVGRSTAKPGLVLTILQWSRPRDLGHFERFGYNHRTFGMRVEGVTTTPFSDRAIDRGLSAIVASGIRHGGMADLPNVAAHTSALQSSAAMGLLELIVLRAANVTNESERAEYVRTAVQSRLDSWGLRRLKLASGRLGYQEALDVHGLLHKPGADRWQLWTAPMSMREVENEVLLQLRSADPSLDIAPAWSYDKEGQS